ncbi:dihydroorotase family protein [Zhouia sp. PK063]|uniref:dihydroorotase family protein n=1 Tax=Zhouia sp. PK063 TaxID=3373602 RepID=UPI00379A233F
MNILLKSAKIVDSSSDFNLATKDILIENGIISKIEDYIDASNNVKEINLENLHISKGWFDSSVCFGEPGLEDRETLANGLTVAAKSGFTTVAINANTYPIIDNNSGVSFIKNKAFGNAVNALPIGALTVRSEGVDLAEMYDMQNAGAVAFYDYQHAISNPNLVKIALQYAQNFDALICCFPQESKIAGKGVVNEHLSGTQLGLKGIPSLAESLNVARDLFILEYTGGKLHIPTISTAKSVALIKEAKEKGLDVTCSVAIHNLIYTDAVLERFDTRYKVLPPLRTADENIALIEGLQDGTIDFVTTDHNPIDIEHKKVEFDHAMYGTIGLEAAFGALQTLFSTEKTVELLTKGLHRFKQNETAIQIGSEANLTLFNPEKTYTFTKSHILSASKNSIYLNTELKGEAYGIINNHQIILK